MRVTPPLHRTPHGQGELQNGGSTLQQRPRVICGHNQGFSAFLSVSADVRWVTARAVRLREVDSFGSNVDQKVKKQVLDQSWYLQSDRGSTSDCTVVREGISATVTAMAIRW